MASSSSIGANVLDAHCFRTLFNQHLYEETAQKKKVIPEVGFNLKDDQDWQEFIIHNIFPTSNKSEVTTTRAVLIHSIIKGDDIRVENLIADSIILITQGLGKKGKLGFPSTIYKLCKDAKVRMREFSNLDLIPEGRYITAEVMETVRVPRIVQQHQLRNEDEDHEMPEYEPKNEADFDNLQHEQEHHQF
ncbi:hypothetical protein PIB30_094968 [Stylosanthes scabra]|uniref:Putative plant transposon protein domain-containing protein n=1 Tax=Stylosanthes scabra TaxID=79078 RepID=A0ABU6TV44_9FABA|nr:hypothetical protein [Stylosanthes scabra]